MAPIWHMMETVLDENAAAHVLPDPPVNLCSPTLIGWDIGGFIHPMYYCILSYSFYLVLQEFRSCLFTRQFCCSSLASGALACLASVLGKVAFDGNTSFHRIARQCCEHHIGGSAACSAVSATRPLLRCQWYYFLVVIPDHRSLG